VTKDEIAKSIDPVFPSVYAPKFKPTKLIFKDGTQKVGFFEFTNNSILLEAENKYTFIEFSNAQQYRNTGDTKYATVVSGENLTQVEYPAVEQNNNENEEIAIDNTAKKVEESDESNVPIKVPFDPNLIRIRRDPYTLGELIDRIEHREINFFTGFQRKEDLWSEKQQCGLIESILLRLPLPAFYFDESEDDKWQVIDGLQRTSAIRNFVVKKTLVLQDLEFLGQFNDLSYDQLPRELHRRIKTTPLTVYVVEKGTPDEVKFNIFKRINTGGLVLTAQEIRHALNQGVASDFIAELAAEEVFKEATCWVIRTDRMEDRDFITRFVSFYLTPYQKYDSDLDSFMTKGMKAIKNQTNAESRIKMKGDFIKAMNTSIAIFGIDAFRKRKDRGDRRKPLNKALFESFSVAFSRLTDAQVQKLIEKGEILKDKFIEINNDLRFEYSLSSGTGQKESVYTRFSEIERIVNETIDK